MIAMKSVKLATAVFAVLTVAAIAAWLHYKTPAHPLRVWVAGDSLVVVPGESLERAAGSGGAIDVLGVESRVATGLGRPDVYNWFTRFPEAVRQLHPKVAVLSAALEYDGR